MPAGERHPSLAWPGGVWAAYNLGDIGTIRELAGMICGLHGHVAAMQLAELALVRARLAGRGIAGRVRRLLCRMG